MVDLIYLDGYFFHWSSLHNFAAHQVRWCVIYRKVNFAGQDVLTKAFCSRALDWVDRFFNKNKCCLLFLKLPQKAVLEKGHSICFYNKIRVFQEYHRTPPNHLPISRVLNWIWGIDVLLAVACICLLILMVYLFSASWLRTRWLWHVRRRRQVNRQENAIYANSSAHNSKFLMFQYSVENSHWC